MSAIKTLADLQKFSTAFINYDTIENMKIRKIPNEYSKILPNHCKCGAEMIITNDLTEAQCCDPYCRIKMGYNLAYFISSLGYKGFGPTLCLRLMDEIYSDEMYPSFLVAFDAPMSVLYSALGEHNAELFLSIKNQILQKPISFRDSIAALGIPNIGDRARIFDILNKPSEILALMVHGKLNDFMEDIGMSAPIYKYGFAVFEPSIAYLYKNIVHNILAESDETVHIAITGEVCIDGVYYTRKRFLDYCNSFVDENGTPFYRFNETLDSKKLDWVIADSPSNSRKYAKGIELGILITSDDFIEKLKARRLK